MYEFVCARFFMQCSMFCYAVCCVLFPTVLCYTIILLFKNLHFCAYNVCVHFCACNVCVHFCACNVCVHFCVCNVCVHFCPCNVCVHIGSEALHGNDGTGQRFHFVLVRYAYTRNRFYAAGHVQLLHFLGAEL